MLIKTTYNPDTGRILATHTSNGKRVQRTVSLTNPHSPAEHGKAAAVLAQALGLVWSDRVLCDLVDEAQYLFLWGTDALIDGARQKIK